MSTLQYTSAAERRDVEQTEGSGAIEPTPFVGTWINTNDSAPHKIAKVVISIKNGALLVHAYGDCSPDLCDWGEVLADVFGENIYSHTAMSFSAVYDFGFLESYLQSNLKHGTLVIATCNKFKDNSGRSNYYTREFFYQIDNQ